MIPPNKDLGDSRQVSARDRWVQRQVEEAMKHLPSNLEVVPSPLLLEEIELAPAGTGSGRGVVDLFTFLSREAEKTLRHSAGLSVPQSAFDGSRLAIPCPGTDPLRRCSSSPPLHTAVKPSPSSRRKKRRRGAPSCGSAGEEVVSLAADVGAATSKPASSSATTLSPRLSAPPVRCSEATPDELEQRLRFYARQIKSFRKTSLLYSSTELIEKIKQMEEDYETAVRQFYCRPPSPTPSHRRAAAAQPMSCLQRAAAAQSTSCLQSGDAAEQATPGLQGAAEKLTPSLQSASAAAAEQSTSGFLIAAAAAQFTSCLRTPAVVEQSTPGLQQSTPGLQLAAEFLEGPVGGLPPRPGPEQLLVFLWGVLAELMPDAQHDTHQPDTPQPGTPQPVMKPDPKGRRKRGVSAEVTEGLDNASAPAHITEGLGNASASAHATEGLGDASASAHATEGPGDASASANATEGLGNASASAHATEGLGDASASVHATESFVLALAPEPRDEGFEEEAPPDPVSGEFKEQLVLVLVSKGSPDSVPVSGGPVGSVPVSEGSPDSTPDYEAPGSQPVYEAPGSQPVYEAPGSQPVNEAPGSKPPEFLGGPLCSMVGLLICRTEGPLLCSVSLLTSLQVPAAGHPGLYVSADLQVFAAVAG
ncbi:hypothetical protein CRENBAI_022692 [Crenichthys baileyi]|uniref:Uncharacterized protein n=1 Tax=Crenichthys baileyi TaxID=28760 RepID=A0AAV9QZ55_9TELE